MPVSSQTSMLMPAPNILLPIKHILKLSLILAVIAITARPASAQQINLSLKEVLTRVEHNLALLEAYRQQAVAIKENASMAKNSMVPELTAGYQMNLATYNNITGMSYPGFMLPISGPPSTTNDLNFVPGSAIGALIKWNPFTFGERNAAINKATAQYKQATAAYNEQLFIFQYTAVNLYLEALYLREIELISSAAIDRFAISLEQSIVLAKNGLKPGIDTAQFHSAMAQAEIDYIQTEKTYLQKLTELTRLTGIEQSAELVVLIDSSFRLLSPVKDSFVVTQHPYFQSAEARKNVTVEALKEIHRAWVPQLDIWGNFYSRGSGIDANGAVDKSDGWHFSRTNAGVGLQLSFPVFQFTKVNIRERQYNAILKADEARLSQAKLDIAKQVESATLQYNEDAKIASKTPYQRKIATEVYEGLKLSYESGLIDFTRFYQSQYDLMKASINDAAAQLQLWRSLLGVAVAKGNLAIFLDQLR